MAPASVIVVAIALLALPPEALGQLAPGCGAAESNARIEPMAPLGPVKVGVAFGSGSMHGLAHIGVIQALEAHGLQVDIVAGTSVGAIVGALWASGYSGAEIEALSDGSNWEEAGAFAGSWQGLFTNDRLREQMSKLFAERPRERWPRRFAAVATDLATGTRRVLDRGDPALDIQASTAVPVLFKPVVIAGERLADGALVEPVPAPTARAMGADVVLAVDVAYRPYEEKASGLTQFGFQSMHILVNALSAEQARYADYALRMDVHHRFMNCGAASLVAAGRQATHEAWPRIERALRAAAARRGPRR